MKNLALILLTLTTLAACAADAPAMKIQAVAAVEKGAIVKMSDKNFDTEFIKYKGIVLVDVSATWCGPCKQMEPIINAAAVENKDKITVVKFDGDESPAVRKRFGVEGAPYFAIVKDGKVLDSHLGTLTKGELQTWIDSALKPDFKPVYNGN